VADKKVVKQKGDNPVAIIDSNISINNYSLRDELAKLTREGKYDEVIVLMKELQVMATSRHPLAPHYRYKMVEFGDKTYFDHEPISKEVLEKYPLSYKGTFRLSNSGPNRQGLFELLEESYLKQQEIEIDMVSFEAWIGGNRVESPLMEETLTEGKWVIPPKPLPEPLKVNCYIEIDGLQIMLMPYLEVNIRDMDREKNILILDNSRQKQSRILITFSLENNFRITESDNLVHKKALINIKLKEEYLNDVEANKELLEILIRLKENKHSLSFNNLNDNKKIFYANKFDLSGDFEELQRDFEFINRILKLEHYFSVDFILPEKVTKEEYDSIRKLESIMEEKPVKFKVNHLKIHLTSITEARETIKAFEDKRNKGVPVCIEYTPVPDTIDLFGAVIQIKRVQADYKSMKIENLQRLKKKLELFDKGDSITVHLIPGSNNTLEERYITK
jgi:hypothetical protein